MSSVTGPRSRLSSSLDGARTRPEPGRFRAGIAGRRRPGNGQRGRRRDGAKPGPGNARRRRVGPRVGGTSTLVLREARRLAGRRSPLVQDRARPRDTRKRLLRRAWVCPSFRQPVPAEGWAASPRRAPSSWRRSTAATASRPSPRRAHDERGAAPSSSRPPPLSPCLLRQTTRTKRERGGTRSGGLPPFSVSLRANLLRFSEP
jgi:hypothetical protein